MYRLSSDIRIKTCDELSFFVNIKNNTLSVVKTNALNYLQEKLKSGLTRDMVNESDKPFKDFVNYLHNKMILEECVDESK